MKKSVKVLALLVVSLFVVVTGVDSALDQISHSPGQGNITIYNEKGVAIYAYSGDLRLCRLIVKAGRAMLPEYVHRG